MSTPFILTAPLNATMQQIKLLALDVDGVLTDGTIFLGTNGIELKGFDIKDGLGIKLAQLRGITVAIITGRASEAVRTRARELGITHLVENCADKLPALLKIAQELSISMDQVAYIGDDLPDIEPLLAVGLAITVADAHEEVKKIAHWTTTRNGGKGAVREVCDLLVTAQSNSPTP